MTDVAPGDEEPAPSDAAESDGLGTGVHVKNDERRERTVSTHLHFFCCHTNDLGHRARTTSWPSKFSTGLSCMACITIWNLVTGCWYGSSCDTRLIPCQWLTLEASFPSDKTQAALRRRDIGWKQALICLSSQTTSLSLRFFVRWPCWLYSKSLGSLTSLPP